MEVAFAALVALDLVIDPLPVPGLILPLVQALLGAVEIALLELAKEPHAALSGSRQPAICPFVQALPKEVVSDGNQEQVAVSALELEEFEKPVMSPLFEEGLTVGGRA